MAERDIPIIGALLNKIIGTRNERFVKKYTQRVNAINRLEPEIRKLTDAQIREKIAAFRQRNDTRQDPEQLMIEAFAVAREAMDRAVGIRNVFNPEKNFDASLLPERARSLYQDIRTRGEALAPVEATGEWLGNSGPVEGWRQVDIPNEMYEAIRELYPESRPPFRARPFDVQLIGGMVLGQGKIAEMRTGEGKTIVAPLASYMAAIERQKVHVVTVNDYLVQRDRDWTFPYFHALGMTVGAIHPQHMQDEDEKRRMYMCDVVYGTTAEFGFDYLRDNMKRSVEQQVQRKRQFAIVDEVDSILVDEARTPLIISGPAHDDQPRYDLADRLARHLVDKQRPWTEANDLVEKCKLRIKGIEGDIRQTRDKANIPNLQAELAKAKAELPGLETARGKFSQYFEIKPERKQAHLTHDGVAEAQRVAGIGSFYVDQNIDLPHLLEQSLRAHVVYERDKDYVIMPAPDPNTGRTVPSIIIVDTNTGRPMVGRQWSDGLHQAMECKERVPIKQETQTVATITVQNFFKMYKRLAGMTGTADTEAQEFHDIYKMDVVAIPTNKQVVRRDYDDMVFMTAKDKWKFIVDEIKAFHDVGGPILVGTTSVEKSETLSKMLMSTHAIQHEVLNAKQHEREAHIVENAGQLGAVMIATNMAGRGTDIKLGKVSREHLLEHWLKRGIAPRTLTVEATDEQLREAIYRKIGAKELGIASKKDIESMPFADLEVELLRHWAAAYTWLQPAFIAKASAAQLRDELDKTGRFLLHRVRWFNSVEDLGGLHVIGTERHEARRIDNQLRGRSGRQGDKGSSRFFVAFEDELMRLFASDSVQWMLSKLGMKEGDAIEHPMVSKNVERAQRKVEERNFQIRKQILEYDEVMEHQRQKFYGLRQRSLEGRDLKGLMFEYIRDSVDDAVGLFLDPEYPAQCAAEFAKDKLDCSISVERLKGKDREQMEAAIRADARYDARHTIDVTLGEYMPMAGSEVSVDFDAAGLANWAKSRFGIDLDPSQLREGGDEERNRVREMLVATAEDNIERADLSGLDKFIAKSYGAGEFTAWVKRKFDFDVDAEEIAAATRNPEDGKTPSSIVLKKAEELYQKREIEYPVDFVMDITGMIMRQAAQSGYSGVQGMQAAAENLVNWSNRRYGLDWKLDAIKRGPQALKTDLLTASRGFVEGKKLEAAVTAAQACNTDADLEAHLKEVYKVDMPDNLRYLEGEERDDAIRARIENLLRSELLQFERTIMIDTLDDLWREHLYSMEKLRDTINFRAFSQQDPRIEYKREGSHMFTTMLENVRDRVTDYIFKGKMTPQVPMMRPPPRQVAPMAAAASATPPLATQVAGGGGGSPGGSPGGMSLGGMGSISGPGLGGITGPGFSPQPSQPPQAPAPPPPTQA
jgi:preprotein translocase subunit SecA